MKLKKLSILLAAASLLLVGCGDSPAPQPPHEHEWGDPTYLWAGDYSDCTATRVCKLDPSHVEKEIVKPSYSVITYPTETSEGLGRYFATFDNPVFVSQTTDVVLPVISDINTYELAVNSVSTKHNYSAHLTNQWADESEPFADFSYYNIDDNAMFDDFNAYFYSGYIKQKNQGIVTFQLNKSATTTGGLILGNFVATNLERSVSDIYSLAVEHLAEQAFTYDESLGLYTSTSMDAMAILANLAFGDYTSLVSAPEYITAKFENGYLIYRGIFDINYFDVEEVHTTGDVSLKVYNFEKTHNSVIESYVAAPDYTYVAPTSWDTDTTALFNQEFNGVIPPFIEGLSYAWKSGQSVSEGFYVAMVEDYFGGDLTPNYRTALESIGFQEVVNPGLIEYRKIVEDENLIHTYSIKMKYYAPTDKDSSHMEYGYLYPNGVTSFKFLHKQKTKETINTVALLNEYIRNTAVGEYLPSFDLASDTRVAHFNDATSSDEDLVLLLKGTEEASDGAFFRIYADTKQHAIDAVEKYVADLRKLGFEGSSSSMFKQYWMTDEYFSQVKITDPSKIETWVAGTSYLQVRIEIFAESLEAWQQQIVELESISVSGQKTVFTVDDEFSFDGIVTAKFSNGYEEAVTPTSVSTPDMSSTGEKTVTVSYEYKGVTKTVSYSISVNSKDTLYSINIIQVPGATITQTLPKDSTQAKANSTVAFEVVPDEGYEIDTVIAKCNGESLTVYGPTLTEEHGFVGYAIVMGSGDVTITAVASKIGSKHNITYVVYNKDTLEVLDFNEVIASTSSLPENAVDGETVTFDVDTNEGYTVNFLWIQPTVLTSEPYEYEVSSDDPKNIVVQIHVIVEGGDEHQVLYSFSMEASGCYWRLTFYDDGTGAYTKTRKSTGMLEATATFKYTYDEATGAVSMSEIQGDPTDFSAYRLTTVSDGTGTNNTGVISEDSLTISLKNNSGTATQYTFTK